MANGSHDKVVYKDLSYKIVGVLFDVYNSLGYGYREKTNERAIADDLMRQGISFKTQVPYSVKYKNNIIGKNVLDFLIEDKIILEIKKGNYFPKQNIEQVKEY